MSPSTRRTRTSKPKSRKGCITCKIRHVKCDEAKPECDQCTRTGRKCDGYTNASQMQLRQAIIQSPPRRPNGHLGADRRIVLVPGTREERQYVQFFCVRTTRALSGFFPSGFWARDLPQLSYRNAAVRHAVAAVGALHLRQLQGRLGSQGGGLGGDDAFTLQQYNKSIQTFLQQMGSGNEMEADLMLIQCLLFVCLEMLQGNSKQAMNHVEGGLRILSRQVQNSSLDRSLYQFFCRQVNQLSYFGRPLTPLIDTVSKDFANVTSSGRLVFDHIDQARDCLTNITTRSLCLIRSVQRHVCATPQHPLHPQQLQQQLALLRECHAWLQAFEALGKKPAATSGMLDPRAPLSMTCQYYTAITWLSTCTSLDEMNLDRFHENFEAVVSAGERLIELCAADQPNSSTEHFFLDADVMPVLYWTVQRCRDPLLRRRALRALSTYPAREGMWDKGLHIAVARRFVALEEAAVTHLPVAQRFPMPQHRVYDAMIASERESRGKCSPVLFRSKPHGVDGPWENRWEIVCW
ncbi:Zn(II)2Cys6 transcription factor domain-containing protein [Aspergillus homomorphus CBS 101889]|uniref:Zn(2)-C6 fungal-type domain-containing protein n=1 Tax=Aspergillus homomorphus (strain CBS 101889) TaxID=1450537 RepID=A0A395HZU4_ASPHC|nr:hypothetical protein BO97DRAFT_391227 [Aspergillus homomorphus CBS 101889]RAL11794.1 hypothetical protein BO97DRAFT_391227 [Aspergillus homomorphus CBS 101889]